MKTKILLFLAFFFCFGLFLNAEIVDTFTSAGTTTWTCPEGVTTVTVECWGGGGAGGTAKNAGTVTKAIRAGGGAGGGYAKKVIPVTPGVNYAIVVGTGGISAADATVGGAPSYFIDATTVKADGGPGGKFNTFTTTYANKAGGVATSTNIGDVVYMGGNGAASYGDTSNGNAGGGGSSAGTSSDGVSAAVATDYLGAIAPEGGGNGGNGASTFNMIGSPGTAPGGGGGGAWARGVGTTQLGGNGGTGKVVLTYTSSAPTLFASPAALTGFTTYVGSASASKSTTITGLLLTGAPENLTVTAPDNYEVSTDNSSFSGSVLVAYSSETLSETAIYVRLKNGLIAGNYNNENVSITGGGLSSAFNLPCSGIVSDSYVWSGGITGDWQVAGNWTPTRTTPTIEDILTINSGGSVTITNVPTEAIAQFLVSGNTALELQASANAVLSIGGYTGDDLSIGEGSSLTLGGSDYTIKMNLATGTTGTISGNVTFTGTNPAVGLNHQIKVADANTIHILSSSIVTGGTNFTGFPFGTTPTDGIVFESGATYIHASGDNAFGGGLGYKVSSFQLGSIYKFTGLNGGTAPAAVTVRPNITKTFGYYIVDCPSQDFGFLSPGAIYTFANDINVKGGRFGVGNKTDSNYGNILGNITIGLDGGITLGDVATSSPNSLWKFNGTSGTQTVTTTDNGYFTQASGATAAKIEIDNDVIFDADVTIAGTLTIAADKTLTIAAGRTLTIDAGATLINNGTFNNNGTLINNGTITSISPINTDHNILIYSNSDNQIVIKCKDELTSKGSVSINNLMGQNILTKQLSGSNTLIENQLHSGIYFITVNIAGKNTTKKVILK
jgi:hypothetical protein